MFAVRTFLKQVIKIMRSRGLPPKSEAAKNSHPQHTTLLTTDLAIGLSLNHFPKSWDLKY